MATSAASDRPVVLGVDLGTGGCKVCAVDREGRVAGTAAAAYETLTPQAGWAEQAPAEWLRAVAEATSQLLQETAIHGRDVAGIAVSCAAHIAVLVDGQGQPTRNAILWNDQRSQPEVEELEEEAGDDIFARTGNRVSTTWTLPHLAWIVRHDPDAWRATERIILSKDYLVYALTGSRTTDPATALSALLYDAVESRWSASLCELADISRDALCEVLPATAVVGHLTDGAARRLGLTPGTPVVNGTLDSAAETYGAGVASPGRALLRLATAGGIHLVHDRMRPHPQLITYPHPLEPLWFSQAGTSSCAASVKWAIDTFTQGRGTSFEQWDREAAGVPPGSEGLVYHPYLAGERCPHWDNQLRASFVGASLLHTSAHFARAVYEGTALSIRDALGVLEEIAPAPTTLTTVGGGTESRLWLRIVCDCLGKPLKVARNADSSYGAAVLGLVGLGFFRDVSEALDSLGGSETEMEPDAGNHALYSELFEKYRRIHAQLATVYHGGDSG